LVDEYLVIFDVLVKEAAKVGLKLVMKKNLNIKRSTKTVKV